MLMGSALRNQPLPQPLLPVYKMTGTNPAQGSAGISNGPKPLLMKKTANRIFCFLSINIP